MEIIPGKSSDNTLLKTSETENTELNEKTDEGNFEVIAEQARTTNSSESSESETEDEDEDDSTVESGEDLTSDEESDKTVDEEEVEEEQEPLSSTEDEESEEDFSGEEEAGEEEETEEEDEEEDEETGSSESEDSDSVDSDSEDSKSEGSYEPIRSEEKYRQNLKCDDSMELMPCETIDELPELVEQNGVTSEQLELNEYVAGDDESS